MKRLAKTTVTRNLQKYPPNRIVAVDVETEDIFDTQVLGHSSRILAAASGPACFQIATKTDRCLVTSLGSQAIFWMTKDESGSASPAGFL